jgi:hypothetical protein
MFKKALPRALLRSSRAFHASPAAGRVVATNPVKAEEVQVNYTTPVNPQTHNRPSLGRLESTRS